MKNLFVLSIFFVLLVLSGCQQKRGTNRSVGQTDIGNPLSSTDQISDIKPDPARKELVYAVENTLDDRVVIHMDMELTKEFQSSFFRKSDLVKRLTNIDGVTEVSLSRYEVRISKAQLFEWTDIIPPVVEMIRKERAPNAKIVERKINNSPTNDLPHLFDFFKRNPLLPRRLTERDLPGSTL